MNIGVDIEEVEKFNKYIKNKEYLERIFAMEEILYSFSKKNTTQHLAVRFAAKEAVLKALRSKNKKIIIVDISVKNNKDGKPEIYIKNKKYKNIDISLSHTKRYAIAVAIVF
ncbi:MAG: holo-ACP synthase [Endomicrobium sp.]|jgi:holo-[acyl-carrier protein] synthase|nr:holo-ACP synthase [Endomicrobium sp.]